MAKATRKIVLKKKSTKKQEKSVTTIPQNTEKNVQTDELKNVQLDAEKNVQNDAEKNVQGDVEKMAQKVLGDVGGSVITKPQGRIKFEAQVAPVPMFLLPEDIRRYLQSHGFSSDLYRKDKEWLEKHNVDMNMVEKLKKFLTEKL